MTQKLQKREKEQIVMIDNGQRPILKRWGVKLCSNLKLDILTAFYPDFRKSGQFKQRKYDKEVKLGSKDGQKIKHSVVCVKNRNHLFWILLWDFNRWTYRHWKTWVKIYATMSGYDKAAYNKWDV